MMNLLINNEQNEFITKLDIQIIFYKERLIPQYKNDINNLVDTKHTLVAYNEILMMLFGSTIDRAFQRELSVRVNTIRMLIDECRNHIDMLNSLED